ncbi:reverse transcriptase domain-containing protein [Tanacetum coccineum]|uniref:Reverse transcriptase domain-containing protein n=1 Tax=Tanacetum coccineum TaxID=301880 RepID=A0ABQ4YLY6_9ASTR
MEYQRTMAEFPYSQDPTSGSGEMFPPPPSIPLLLERIFDLKQTLNFGLLNLVTSKQFYGFEKEDPHAHIHCPDLARKEPPCSILTWEDLVSKFINQFFPPSKTTNLQNEITNFQQRFDESFCEGWDRFKDLFRAYPHHGFTELHQLYTFYNALTPTDQDSLNAAAGCNLLTKTPRDALTIIENKSKVRNSRNKPIVLKKSSPPTSVKAVEEICVTCGGPHPYHQCLATDDNIFPEYRDNIQGYVSVAALLLRVSLLLSSSQGGGTGNRIGKKDTVQLSTENIQPPVVQTQAPIDEPVVTPKPKPSIPYPSIANKQYDPVDLAKTPVNENCSEVILKKLSGKLGDPDKFLIPCDFPGIVECLALADLGASYQLMPFLMEEDLTPPPATYSYSNCILELA